MARLSTVWLCCSRVSRSVWWLDLCGGEVYPVKLAEKAIDAWLETSSLGVRYASSERQAAVRGNPVAMVLV
jgi:hypothetical protein